MCLSVTFRQIRGSSTSKLSLSTSSLLSPLFSGSSFSCPTLSPLSLSVVCENGWCLYVTTCQLTPPAAPSLPPLLPVSLAHWTLSVCLSLCEYLSPSLCVHVCFCYSCRPPDTHPRPAPPPAKCKALSQGGVRGGLEIHCVL